MTLLCSRILVYIRLHKPKQDKTIGPKRLSTGAHYLCGSLSDLLTHCAIVRFRRTTASCSYEHSQSNNQVLASLSVSTCAFKVRHYRNQQINSLDEKSDTGVPDRYNHLNAWVSHTPTIPTNTQNLL